MQALFVLVFLAQQWSPAVNLGIAGVDDMYPQTHQFQAGWFTRLCIVWQALRGGNWEIYSRFTTADTWSDTVRVTNHVLNDRRPSVVYDDNNDRFWCAWAREGAIYAAYSISNSWSTPEVVVLDGANNYRPSISMTTGNYPLVVWERYMADSINIYSSHRSGGSWSLPIPVTNDAGLSNVTPQLAFSIVVWERQNDVYYSRYSGGSWQASQPITTSAANDSVPDITLNYMGLAAVCWQSDQSGDWEIYRTATDTFTTHYRVTNNSAVDVAPCPIFYYCVVDQHDVPMIAFCSNRNGHDDIYAASEWYFLPVDTNPAQDLFPAATANSHYLWTVWQSDRNTDWDIYGSYMFIWTDIKETSANSQPVVYAAKPNPFKENIRIAYNAGHNAKIKSIKIFNAFGLLVRNLPYYKKGADCFMIEWDGRDGQGNKVVPGIYFTCLETDRHSIRQKIVKID